MLIFQVPKKTQQQVKYLLKNNVGIKQKFDKELKLKTMGKRILRVYLKEDRFFIDSFAAHALGLTSVRQVMTGEMRLFEIDQDQLEGFQNDKEIEVRFVGEKGIEELPHEISLEETFEEMDSEEYGIGIHGIDKGTDDERRETASSISDTGLRISNNYKTILSTAVSLGTDRKTSLPEIQKNIVQYRMGFDGTRVNVVIAVPLVIKNENGEQIFLGFPEKNGTTAGQQHDPHCICDMVCSNMQNIPPEFILGYYYEKSDGSGAFIPNPKHYSKIDVEKKEELFETIRANMPQAAKDFNQLIIDGDEDKIAGLFDFKKRQEILGNPTYLLDSVIEFVKRIHWPKVRRILDCSPSQNVEETNSSEMPEREHRVRKILVGSIEGVRQGELSGAAKEIRSLSRRPLLKINPDERNENE